MSKFGIVAALVLCICVGLTGILLAEPPASQPATAPAVIDIKDKDALKINKDQKVTLEGMVDSAQWSKSGQVMDVTFKDNSDVMCVLFVKNRDAMDKAFGGNAAEKWSGATIHVTGTLAMYTGRLKSLRNKMQIIINTPDQVTIVQPSPGK